MTTTPPQEVPPRRTALRAAAFGAAVLTAVLFGLDWVVARKGHDGLEAIKGVYVGLGLAGGFLTVIGALIIRSVLGRPGDYYLKSREEG